MKSSWDLYIRIQKKRRVYRPIDGLLSYPLSYRLFTGQQLRLIGQ